MTLALCVCVECIGSLSLTKPTMQQRFHTSAKHLLYKCNTPSFVGHSLRVKGETCTVLFCQFIVVHFDFTSNIFSCRYASTGCFTIVETKRLGTNPGF